MENNLSNKNENLPIDVTDGHIHCPNCNSSHIAIADTLIFEFSDEENGFCVVDYRCKNCNCKFRGNIHFKYRISSVDDFKILH